MKEQVKEIAVNLFNSVLKISADNQGTFRLIVTAKIENEEKPLLVLGNAHAQVEDGHCIAILNPEESLLEKVIAGCAYMGNSLKEIVQGQCDLMIELWIDAYKEDGIGEISSYRAREQKAARFEVR